VLAMGKELDQSREPSRAPTWAPGKGKEWDQLKVRWRVAMWWALQLTGRAKVHSSVCW